MVTFEAMEEAALPLGARLVGELGGFLPFAIVANADGDLEQFNAPVDSWAAEVYQFLLSALSAGAKEGRFSAVALVTHERTPPELEVLEENSIHGYIDIEDLGAKSVYIPYSEADDGSLAVGSVIRVEKDAHFFAHE